MADRVSVSIAIGGCLAAHLVDEFVALIQADLLATDWDGEPFDAVDLSVDGPLRLYAHDVRNGELEALEAFCCAHGLAYRRSADGRPGAFDPEIVLCTGDGAPQLFVTNDGGCVVIDEQDVARLGSYAAIEQYFADAAFQPPRFCVGSMPTPPDQRAAT